MLVLYAPLPPWSGLREVEPNVLEIVAGDPYGITATGGAYVDYGAVTPGERARVLLDAATGKVMLERIA